VRMLDDLADDLDRRSKQLVIAHGIGQVRDMLREGEPARHDDLRLFATVREAVVALRTP